MKHQFLRSLPQRKFIYLAVAACLGMSDAAANPTGAAVVSGQAGFNTQGGTLSVTNSPGAIINWQGFSIGANETTRFLQQSAASSVLNRVVGPDPSTILGTLTSNGRVFLVNPSGIFVGQGARLDVGGLVASTLNLSNTDFLAGRHNYQPVPNAGSIVNYGAITTPTGGSVYLVAPNVSNNGIINTPQGEVILAAGNSVQLIDTSTPGVRVQFSATNNKAENLGEIIAESGRVGVVGALVRNRGLVNASSVVREGGRVFFKASQDAYVDGAGRIVTTGTKGGSIEVLGEQVTVANKTVLDASGEQGGNILVKADMKSGTATIAGTFLARGGTQGGDGGFIETSGGQVKIADSAHMDTSAPAGKGGSWLIDPQDFTIAPSGGDMTGGALSANLNTNNVFIQSTSGATAGNGDIFVNDAINKTGAARTSLNLQAERSIVVNSPITSSAGPLDVTLNAHYRSDTAPGNVNILASINTYGGNLRVGGGFDPYQTPAIGYGPGGTWGNNTAVQRYGVYITNNAVLDTGTGSINISGRGYDNPVSDSDGINLYKATLQTSSGSIRLNGRTGNSGSGGGTAGIYAGLSTIQSTGSGGLTLIGIGGVSTTTANNNNSYIRGVKISGSTILVNGGFLSITGVGGDATGMENKGVLIEQNGSTPALIESTGYGRINITGNACFYSVCTYAPTYATYGNDGIAIRDASSIIRTSYSNGGGINLSGRGIGTGIGYAGSDAKEANTGIHNAGQIINTATNSNSVIISGTGASGGGGVGTSYGVYFQSGSSVSAAGSTSVTGSGGMNISSSSDLYVGGALSSTSGTGYVSLRADSGSLGTGTILFGSSGSLSVNSTGGNLYYNPVSYTDPTTRSDVAGNPYSAKITGSNAAARMLVNDVNGLQAMNTNLAGHYALGKDIDAITTSTWNGGTGFSPIGGPSANFTGSLDGQNRTISNLTINQPSGSYVGLFGYTNSASSIWSVGLANVNVTGQYWVGGLAGYNLGTVSNTYTAGSVSGTNTVGGLIGLNQGSVNTSYSSGSVTGSGVYIGGLVGYNPSGGFINSSYAASNITGGSQVGGLVGYQSGGGISNSYSTGSVSGTTDIGGLVGNNFSGSAISNSYATGGVSAVSAYGGLIGNNSGAVTNSFWDTVTSNQTVGVGAGSAAGVSGLSTLNARQSSNYAGWDFTSAYPVWGIIEGKTYPYLPSVSATVQGTGQASGTVTILSKGSNLASGTTDGAGTYAIVIPKIQAGYGSTLLSYMAGYGGSAQVFNGSNISGLDIAGNTLSLYANGTSSNTNLKTAKGGNTATDFLYTVPAGNDITLGAGVSLVSNAWHTLNGSIAAPSGSLAFYNRVVMPGNTGELSLQAGQDINFFQNSSVGTSSLVALKNLSILAKGNINVTNSYFPLDNPVGNLFLLAGWDGNQPATPIAGSAVGYSTVDGPGHGSINILSSSVSALGNLTLLAGDTVNLTVTAPSLSAGGTNLYSSGSMMLNAANQIRLTGGNAGYGWSPGVSAFSGGPQTLTATGSGAGSSGAIVLQAGSGGGAGASISSNSTQAITSKSMSLAGGASGQNNYAQINSNGNQNLIVGSGGIQISGGASGYNNWANINSNTGAQQITTGSLSVIGGGSTSTDSNNTAMLISGAGQTINVAGNLTLTAGGIGTGNQVHIDAHGVQQIGLSGTLTVTGGVGGTNNNAFVQQTSSGGNQSIAAQDITLNAGSGGRARLSMDNGGAQSVIATNALILNGAPSGGTLASIRNTMPANSEAGGSQYISAHSMTISAGGAGSTGTRDNNFVDIMASGTQTIDITGTNGSITINGGGLGTASSNNRADIRQISTTGGSQTITFRGSGGTLSLYGGSGTGTSSTTLPSNCYFGNCPAPATTSYNPAFISNAFGAQTIDFQYGGSLNLVGGGGVGSIYNFAGISNASTGLQTITSSNGSAYFPSIGLTGGTSGQINVAYIDSLGTQLLNASSLTLAAGASGLYNQSFIVASGGAQNISAYAGISLTGGAGGSLNYARMFGSGGQRINTSGITLGGGADGTYNDAQISANGDQLINASAVTIQGGAGTSFGNFAQISHGASGDQTINITGGPVVLTAGSGTGVTTNALSLVPGICASDPKCFGQPVSGDTATIFSGMGNQTVNFQTDSGVLSLTGGSGGNRNLAAISNGGTGVQTISGFPSITLTSGASGGNDYMSSDTFHYLRNSATLFSSKGAQAIQANSLILNGTPTGAAITAASIIGSSQNINVNNAIALNSGASSVANTVIESLGNQSIAAGSIVLNAGGGSGNSARVVAYGEQAISTAGSVTLTGGASGSDNRASVEGGVVQTTCSPGCNLTPPPIPSSRLQSITANGIVLHAGTDGINNSVSISGGGASQSLTAGGSGIQTVGGMGGSGNRASIDYYGDPLGAQTIAVTGGDISVIGGGGVGNWAQMRSTGNGPQLIAANNIMVHGGAGGSNNRASVESWANQTISASSIAVTAGGTTAVGNNYNDVALIDARGNQIVNVTGSGVTITGGGAGATSWDNYAGIRQLSSSAGSQRIVFQGSGAALTLTAGSGSGMGSLALNGCIAGGVNVYCDSTQRTSNNNAAINNSFGDQTIDFRYGGSMSMVGGANGINNSAGINNSSTGQQKITSSNGSAYFPAIALTGGASGGAFGMYGGSLAYDADGLEIPLRNGAGIVARYATASSRQSIDASSIVLTGAGDAATIGGAYILAPYQSINSTGSIVLTGGAGDNGTLDWPGSTMAAIASRWAAGDLQLAAGGSLALQGGSGRSSTALLGASRFNSNVLVNVGGDIVVNAGSSAYGTNDVQSVIGTSRGLGGAVQLAAGRDIYFGDGTGITSRPGTVPTASTKVALLAKRDISLGHFDIDTLGGNLTLKAGWDGNATAPALATAAPSGGNGGSISMSGTRIVNAEAIDIQAFGSLMLDSISGSTIFGWSGADLTLNSGATLSASASGDALVLATKKRFTNKAGEAALSTPGGRWLAYSADPAADARGGLAYSFKQYGLGHSGSAYTGPGSGNGFIYSLAAPAVTPTLTGTVAKTYDGTTTASLSPANYAVTGAIDGDTIVLNNPGSGAYIDRNAGSSKDVSATVALASASNGAASVYGYQLSSTTASGTIGQIDKAALTINAIANTKTYDGTTSAAAVPTVTGTLYAGDTLTSLVESYASRNVGTGKTLSVSNYALSDGNGGANYQVSLVSNSSGVIDKAPLTISAVTNAKSYDGTTSAAAIPSVTGTVFPGDTLTGLTETYADSNAGTAKTLSVSGYTLNDGNGGANYLVNLVTNNEGVITPTAEASVTTQQQSVVATIGATTVSASTVATSEASTASLPTAVAPASPVTMAAAPQDTQSTQSTSGTGGGTTTSGSSLASGSGTGTAPASGGTASGGTTPAPGVPSAATVIIATGVVGGVRVSVTEAGGTIGGMSGEFGSSAPAPTPTTAVALAPSAGSFTGTSGSPSTPPTAPIGAGAATGAFGGSGSSSGTTQSGSGATTGFQGASPASSGGSNSGPGAAGGTGVQTASASSSGATQGGGSSGGPGGQSSSSSGSSSGTSSNSSSASSGSGGSGQGTGSRASSSGSGSGSGEAKAESKSEAKADAKADTKGDAKGEAKDDAKKDDKGSGKDGGKSVAKDDKPKGKKPAACG